MSTLPPNSTHPTLAFDVLRKLVGDALEVEIEASVTTDLGLARRLRTTSEGARCDRERMDEVLARAITGRLEGVDRIAGLHIAYFIVSSRHNFDRSPALVQLAQAIVMVIVPFALQSINGQPVCIPEFMLEIPGADGLGDLLDDLEEWAEAAQKWLLTAPSAGPARGTNDQPEEQ